MLKYSTISVLDRDGKEIRFLRSCSLEDYLSSLGAEDAVILEASCGCFYWADRIEESGATRCVLDPRRFRIITESWNKIERQDARNMAKALWVFQVTGEFGIPTVYKRNETIRTLRRLFATYNLLHRQIRVLKNAIQAMLTDDGVILPGWELFRKRQFFHTAGSGRGVVTSLRSAARRRGSLDRAGAAATRPTRHLR
jgi:transposase